MLGNTHWAVTIPAEFDVADAHTETGAVSVALADAKTPTVTGPASPPKSAICTALSSPVNADVVVVARPEGNTYTRALTTVALPVIGPSRLPGDTTRMYRYFGPDGTVTETTEAPALSVPVPHFVSDDAFDTPCDVP